MIKQVHEKISVCINGKMFKLVYDADIDNVSACDQCALLGKVCRGSIDKSLLCLCATIVEEPNTFFVEAPGDIMVHGINNQEITLSALFALRDAEEKNGNHARAIRAQSLIDQI
jgi:hypothetical protein